MTRPALTVSIASQRPTAIWIPKPAWDPRYLRTISIEFEEDDCLYDYALYDQYTRLDGDLPTPPAIQELFSVPTPRRTREFLPGPRLPLPPPRKKLLDPNTTPYSQLIDTRSAVDKRLTPHKTPMSRKRGSNPGTLARQSLNPVSPTQIPLPMSPGPQVESMHGVSRSLAYALAANSNAAVNAAKSKRPAGSGVSLDRGSTNWNEKTPTQRVRSLPSGNANGPRVETPNTTPSSNCTHLPPRPPVRSPLRVAARQHPASPQQSRSSPLPSVTKSQSKDNTKRPSLKETKTHSEPSSRAQTSAPHPNIDMHSSTSTKGNIVERELDKFKNKRQLYQSGQSAVTFASLLEMYSPANQPPPLPIPALPNIMLSNEVTNPAAVANAARSAFRGRERSGSGSSMASLATRKKRSGLSVESTNTHEVVRERVASPTFVPGRMSTTSLSSSTSSSRDRSRSDPLGRDSVSSPPPTDSDAASTVRGALSPSSTIFHKSVSTSSLPDHAAPPPTKQKRQHALLELLNTERAYASDLVLVQSVHMPLALGLNVQIGGEIIGLGQPPTTISSTTTNGRSTNTLSITSSNASTHTASSRGSGLSISGSSGPPNPLAASTSTQAHATATTTTNTTTTDERQSPSPANNETPMTQDDVRVIFGNIEQLAVFADGFAEEIEAALGAEISGGNGVDRVGELFVKRIPIMTPIFCQFMVRHASALARFAKLEASATPAMKQYLEDTKAISMAHSNAWNLSSMLIKPIQRFTKYPLLLAAIVDATFEEHPDYQCLLNAKSMMLDAVKKVNEDSRRRDVVRAVLEGKGLKGVVATVAPAAAALATTGSVSRIKSLRTGFSVGRKDKDKDKAAGEEDATLNGPNGAISPGLNGSFDDTGTDKTPGGALDDLHKRLKEFEAMIPKYTGDVIVWVKSVRETLVRLEAWTLAFEKVIALSDDGGIEALQAFRNVLADRLTGVIDALDNVVHFNLIPSLVKLADTMKGPLLLLQTAGTLRSSYVQLLNTPYGGKNGKPPQSIVDASGAYMALAEQLCIELPVYLKQLDHGFALIITQVARWQQKWWNEVAGAWSDLWRALGVGPGDRKSYKVRRNRERARKKGYKAAEEAGPPPEPGEYGCDAQETSAIWWERWEEIGAILAEYDIASGATIIRAKEMKKNFALLRSSSRLGTGTDTEFSDLQSEYEHVGSPPISSSLNSFLPEVSPNGNKKPKKLKHSPSAGQLRSLSNDTFSMGPTAGQATSTLGGSMLFGFGRRKSGQKDKEKAGEKEKGTKTKDKAQETIRRRTEPTIPTLNKSGDEPAVITAEPEALPGSLPRRASLKKKATSESSKRDGDTSSIRNGKIQRSSEPPVPRERITSVTPSVRSLPPSSSLTPSVRRQPSTSSQVPSTKLPTANEELIDDEWVRPPTMEDLIVAPTRFICAVVANYKPSLQPYAGFDWLDLEVNQKVDIVVEAGPPAAHPEIKPVVDDGEDMLLIARRYRPDIRGYRVEVGWVWASFIVPVQDEGQ